MYNVLSQERLLSLLMEAARNRSGQIPASTWQNAYDEFCIHTARLVDTECSPSAIRTINHTRIEIDMLYNHVFVHGPQCEMAGIYCLKTLEVLNKEMEILILKIEHPKFAAASKMPTSSQLYMNDNYHLTDFVEIIVALYELNFCKTADNMPAKLTMLTNTFEWAFNVNLKSYDSLRHSAITRKLRPASFLDKMREVLIRLNEQ